MRKIILILIILFIGGYIFIYSSTGFNPQPKLEFRKPADSTFKPDPSSATFIFDDGTITLNRGFAEKKFADSEFTEEISLLDKIFYGDINGDKKDDAIVFLKRYGGGSGTFIYTAAYVSGPVNYKGTNAVFLGDRISPESISVSGGIAIVKYLDRKNDESFATEPTILVSKEFKLRNSLFEEI